MKNSLISVALLAGILTFASCNKNDGPSPKPYTKSDPYWSLFWGTIDGKKYEVANTRYDKPITTNKSGNYQTKDGSILPYQLWRYSTGILFDKSSLLQVSLYDPHPGSCEAPYGRETFAIWDNSVSVSLLNNPSQYGSIIGGIKATYSPTEKDPIIVDIVSVDSTSSSNTTIQLHLYGTLYNVDDPNDSIEISGTFGINF